MPIHDISFSVKMSGAVWQGYRYEDANTDVASGVRQQLIGRAWLADRSECGPVTLQPEPIEGDEDNVNVTATATSYVGCAVDAVSMLLEAMRAPADTDAETEADMEARIAAKLADTPLAAEIEAVADHQPTDGSSVTLDDLAGSLAKTLFRYRSMLRA